MCAAPAAAEDPLGRRISEKTLLVPAVASDARDAAPDPKFLELSAHLVIGSVSVRQRLLRCMAEVVLAEDIQQLLASSGAVTDPTAAGSVNNFLDAPWFREVYAFVAAP